MKREFLPLAQENLVFQLVGLVLVTIFEKSFSWLQKVGGKPWSIGLILIRLYSGGLLWAGIFVLVSEVASGLSNLYSKSHRLSYDTLESIKYIYQKSL